MATTQFYYNFKSGWYDVFDEKEGYYGSWRTECAASSHVATLVLLQKEKINREKRIREDIDKLAAERRFADMADLMPSVLTKYFSDIPDTVESRSIWKDYNEYLLLHPRPVVEPTPASTSRADNGGDSKRSGDWHLDYSTWK